MRTAVKDENINDVPIAKAIIIYLVVSLFLFFEMAVQVSPSVMSSQLMQDLNIGTFGLGLMTGFYFYTYTAMQLPSGLLFDRYNPRLIITLSILLCAFGTFFFAFATNIYVGSFARLLMGTGSAFAFVSVLVVTSDLFPSKYFATMTGFTQMLAAFGAMSGQMPVSYIVSSIGWRDTMFSLAIIGVILSVTIWNVLKYKKNDGHNLQSNNKLNTKQTLKGIASDPKSWFLAIYACLLWAPMSGFASLWGVPFLVRVDHLDKSSAAFLCSLMWLGLAFASPILGIVSTALKRRVVPLAFVAFVGALSFGLVLEFTLSKWLLGSLLFLAGMACSGQALTFSVVRENNSRISWSTAIAFNNMAVVISGAVFQPLIGKLLQLNKTTMLHDAGIYSSADFKMALLTILVSYIVAFFVASFFIKETFCRDYSDRL